MRLMIALAVLAGLLGANITVFIASTRQFQDAAAQRQAVIGERHAIEAQRVAVERIGQHMREWLAGSHRCKADTQQYVLPDITDS